MKTLLTLCLLVSFLGQAQNFEGFHATMSLQDAKELKKDVPAQVEILKEYRNEAVVYMTEEASHLLHDRVLVHGPGYIFMPSLEAAIEAVEHPRNRARNSLLSFSITEDVAVDAAINVINIQNIENHILELEGYGTRYHTMASATQAAEDLKVKWEDMAASYSRTDVSVRLFNHSGTGMPSVIMTITGAEIPEEFVVVGGHLDSTSSQGNDDAPGADDDASGIATITEAVRALFETNFVPKRTIEVMAYAAEEIGLVGSNEIATQYDNNNVDVIAVGQFDMTNYNGSTNDVSLITDFTSGNLNLFMMNLMDHYNASGEHAITYATSLCNYGCSDHASWTGRGYWSTFPFEANFGQHNGSIHTAGDVYSLSGTAVHATKFAKLCAEFLIEIAKSEGSLGVPDVSVNTTLLVNVNQGVLQYDIQGSSQEFDALQVHDLQGKLVLNKGIETNQGQIALPEMSTGIYVVSLASAQQNSISQKVLVK